MEIYCKVKKDNPVYKQYFDWWNNLDIVKRRWEQFRKLVGIESTQFAPNINLCIIPTENDLIKFGRFFTKEELNRGVRRFKATSMIQKDWERFCNCNDVKFIQKPIISFDFHLIGNTKIRLFHYQDEIYCSLDNENMDKDYKIPEGYEKIKASEFYKIIETIEEEENE